MEDRRVCWRQHLCPRGKVGCLHSDRGTLPLFYQCLPSFQAMFDWLDNAVIKLCNMSPVGTDLNTVKEQMNEMKVRGWSHTASPMLCIAELSLQ